MDYTQNVKDQLRKITVEKLQGELVKEGWVADKTRNATIPYVLKGENGETVNRVVIHVHPKKTFGLKLLEGLINQIGWSIEDMQRLKLIK